MKKPLLPIAVICLVFSFVLTACAFTYGHATWRYRMTVEVETPEGIKTGSAVREIHAFSEPKILPEQSGGHAGVSKGEAVVVDLGKRGVLFALMRGGKSGEDYGWHIVFDAFPYKPGKYLTGGANQYYSELVAGPKELSPDLYPKFVRFRDLKSPKTVEAVSATNKEEKPAYSPQETIRTFESAFGLGVRLKAVSIEMTKDQVTWEVNKWLPWIGTVKDYLDGKNIGGGPELANILYKWDFLKGKTK